MKRGRLSGARSKGFNRTTGVQDSPPARRRRKDPVALKDEAFIRGNMHVPTQEDYPKLKARIFKLPKEAINLYVRDGTLKKESRGLGRGVIQYTISCDELDIGKVEGEGTSKATADTAACLHLMAKLHELGEFERVFGTNWIIDKDVLKDQKDAKTDIYNYAACFDCVPEFHIKPLHLPSSRRHHGVQVEVTMPQQGINVVGKGKTLQMAEIAAALKFKEAAERFQVSQGTESLVIRGSSTLTTHNARAFFDFYKIQHRRIAVEVEVNSAEDMKSYSSNAPHRAQVLVDKEPIGKPVYMVSKKQAEDLAYLTAALEVKSREPDIYPLFLQALRAGNGEILKPLPPIDMSVDELSLAKMRQTLMDAREAGLADEVDEASPDDEIQHSKGLGRPTLSEGELSRKHMQMQQAYTAYLQNPRLEELRRKRAELPMNQYKDKVLELISQNPYSIIVGATGSGKTTQVPQIILEDATMNGTGGACNIICTQPRRIAATSVARRVAEERAEHLEESVGYHVRFEPKLPRFGGSIKYCTTGILLQQLQHHPDEILNSTSHIVIDEVHERDIIIDFLLILLKKTMAQRLAGGKTGPKIVLMSATMDTDLFASYFSTHIDGKEHCCPSLSVPGRAFPVKERYLDSILGELRATHESRELQLLSTDPQTKEYLAAEQEFTRANLSLASGEDSEIAQPEDFVIDWKKERKVTAEGEVVVSTEKEDRLVPCGLIATTIAHIAKTSTDGAILAFLPGLDEIVEVEKLLQLKSPLGIQFGDKSKYEVYKLHSTLAAGQKEVFDDVPPGCRKIILATNIAETSITIPDVQYVVDSGKLRENQYDQLRRLTKLQCTWISKSNSKQRAGRAGRVQNGNYYAIFSKARYESLRAIGLPEMLRANLEEICLRIKAQAFKAPIREFLAEAIEPPSPKTIDSSVMSLQALEALTDDERLTPLGRLLASLPVHPSLGKMIVLGIIFRCLDPMLILGAALGERQLFTSPLGSRNEAQDSKLSFVKGSSSDHIAALNAFRHMRNIRAQKNLFYMKDFGLRNFIHVGCFNSIDSTARQIEEILVEAGLIPYTPPYAQANSEYGDPALNKNAHKTPLIKALLMAGLRPNLAIQTAPLFFRTASEKSAMVHRSSVNAPSSKTRNGSQPYDSLYSFTALMRPNDSNGLFMRDTSRSTPLMAVLFGGKLRQEYSVLRLDGWLPFYVKSRHRSAPRTVFEFREAMERLFASVFNDLAAKRRARGGAETGYLADDEVREVFEEGLVEVLMQDAKTTGTDPGTDSDPAWEKKMANNLTFEQNERNAFDSWTPRDQPVYTPWMF
ncbi:MAG: hypothetical protein Q9195_004580 [Heterodermia aff. obscurata]